MAEQPLFPALQTAGTPGRRERAVRSSRMSRPLNDRRSRSWMEGSAVANKGRRDAGEALPLGSRHGELDDFLDQPAVGPSGLPRRHGELGARTKPGVWIDLNHLNPPVRLQSHVHAAIVPKFERLIGSNSGLLKGEDSFFRK